MRCTVWAVWAAMGGLTGCGAPQFPCEADEECNLLAGGVCADAGYCAYPNEGCPSGFSYHAHAPAELAGSCAGAEETDTGCVGDGCSLPACGEPLAVDFYAKFPAAPDNGDVLNDVAATDASFLVTGRQRASPYDSRLMRWQEESTELDADLVVQGGSSGSEQGQAVTATLGRAVVGGVFNLDSIGKPFEGGRAFLAVYSGPSLETSAGPWQAPTASSTIVLDLAAADGRVYGVGAWGSTMWVFTFDSAELPATGTEPQRLDMGGQKGVVWTLALVGEVSPEGKQELVLGGEASGSAWLARATYDTTLAAWESFAPILQAPQEPEWGSIARAAAVSPDGAWIAFAGQKDLKAYDGVQDADVWVRVMRSGGEWEASDLFSGGAPPPTPDRPSNPKDTAHGLAFTSAGDLMVVGEFGADGDLYWKDGFAVTYPAGSPISAATREEHTCVFRSETGRSAAAYGVAAGQTGQVVVVGTQGQRFWGQRLPPP